MSLPRLAPACLALILALSPMTSPAADAVPSARKGPGFGPDNRAWTAPQTTHRPRLRMRPRRMHLVRTGRGFGLEAMEPRLLLSADISYMAQADSHFTLRMDDVEGVATVRLLDSNTQIVYAQLVAEAAALAIDGAPDGTRSLSHALIVPAPVEQVYAAFATAERLPMAVLMVGLWPSSLVALMFGVLALLFGLMAPTFTGWMLAAPKEFIMVLGGLAMLRVLQGAFVASFGAGKFSLGALVSLLVTVADIGLFNIGAAFWGLVAGTLTLFVEHFRARPSTTDRTPS